MWLKQNSNAMTDSCLIPNALEVWIEFEKGFCCPKALLDGTEGLKNKERKKNPQQYVKSLRASLGTGFQDIKN